MSKEILETVARESLLEAARQRRELGDLRENLFRYIVMNKLLFVQSGAGIFPNFEQHDYPKTFQWIL